MRKPRTGEGRKIDRPLPLDDTSLMRRFAPLSWAKLMGLLLIMAGLLQHPVRSHESIGSIAGVHAEFLAGGEAVGSVVLALQNDGLRVLRPERPLERSVEPQLAVSDGLFRFDRAAFPRAGRADAHRSPPEHQSPRLVGIVELRI